MSAPVLSRLGNAVVAVIGDVMIDVYLMGRIERISPEAPVPIVRAASERGVPGGAANVAANLAVLGASALLVGVVGPDGDDLRDELRKLGVSQLGGLVVDEGRRTTRKQRILAGQQVVRIDFEDTYALSATVEAALVERALAAVRAADVVVLSDYGKGVLTPSIIAKVNGLANQLGKMVLVDPKRSDLAAYRGASILTPNRSELSLATGLACETDGQVEFAVRKAQADFGGSILLTRSEKGMSHYPVEGEVTHFPTRAREVFDVSGAGDTVVATLAAVLAAGAEVAEAIRIANHAAGIVVAKAGTATVSLDELTEELESADGHGREEGALVSRERAAVVCRRWQRRGLKVGFANGCFDLIHPGHIGIIRQAAAACDRLIMALNTDASVRRLKGPKRPVQSEAARAEVIGAIKGVDLVVLFDEDTPLELITDLQPDVLFKGSDYTIETVVGAEVVLARGGSVVLAELIAGHSTTRLIDAAA
jgi:D-beta-D-heptose 7-phosphate kinase/D-beta-D-heptose 1-phosphate adenosyltransferase